MQKKIATQLIVALACSIPVTSYAVADGFYMGAMLGVAQNHAQNKAIVLNGIPVIAKPPKNNAAVRVYLGTKFYNFFGIELGGTYYQVVDYTTTPVVQNSSVKTGIATVDLVAVGFLPLGCYFDVFGKAGYAAVYQGTSVTLRNPNQNKYTTTARPTFTIGADWNVTQNWLIDLSWTRLMAKGLLQNVDFYAIGFSYHFVNKYCGQFLCD